MANLLLATTIKPQTGNWWHYSNNNNVQESSPHDKTNKVFREIKPVGDTIIFGDSNTRGLDRKRLAMGIGSLSGATLDSVIAYLQNDPTPSEAIKRVIYHVGTNNISIDQSQAGHPEE